MMTYTMANQANRRNPPEQSLATDLHAAECQPTSNSLTTSTLFLQTSHDVDETLSFTRFFSSTITCSDIFQHSPDAVFSFLNDNIRTGDKLQIGDNAALRETLINCQLWLITGDTPTKRGPESHLFIRLAHY